MKSQYYFSFFSCFILAGFVVFLTSPIITVDSKKYGKPLAGPSTTNDFGERTNVSFHHRFILGACFLGLVCHARGATITSSGLDVFNATNTYTIQINNGGNEQNPTFGNNSAVTNPGDSFTMGSYSSLVPDFPGSLNSAFLTLSWSASPVNVTGTGTATYTPTFAATTHSATFVTITAGKRRRPPLT